MRDVREGKLNLNYDWHVHTPCSCDCQLNPLIACETAEAIGLEGICFTDHIDFDPRDDGVGFFNWKRYLDFIQKARIEYPNLNIKTGFELNWQKKYKPQILDFLQDKKIDFLLGSVHWVNTGFINEKNTYKNLSFDDFIEDWSREALDLLKQDICDGFAHFDYFCLQTKFLFPEISREDIYEWTEPVVDAIISNEVSLEINTSALRKGLNEPFPCWNFITKYFKKGGSRVHLGSDSHEKWHIGFKFNLMTEKIRNLKGKYKNF